MKPIVIIAIAVGCSIIAMIGVSFAMEMYAVYHAQQGMKNYLEHEELCDDLFEELMVIHQWRADNGIHILHPDYADSENEVMRLDSDYQRECRNHFEAKKLALGN